MLRMLQLTMIRGNNTTNEVSVKKSTSKSGTTSTKRAHNSVNKITTYVQSCSPKTKPKVAPVITPPPAILLTVSFGTCRRAFSKCSTDDDHITNNNSTMSILITQQQSDITTIPLVSISFLYLLTPQ